uniref:ROK family protein n=1 Tax=Sphingomonas bacterium TaxID=1895847 RepID=UPI0015772D1B
TPAPDLPADDPAWDLIAHAIAQACHALVLTGVPRRIVIGGGVMVGTPHLFPRVRRMLHDSLGGYLATAELAELDSYVVPPRLGGRAGPLGALVLAHQALEKGTLTGP